MLQIVLFTVVGFLSGGVMCSYLLPLHVKGIDVVKDSRDGNAGVWNVNRFAGKGMAGVCLVLDLLKGALPVFVAWHFVNWTDPSFIPVVVAPVVGHIVSPYNRILSGKGITTSFGVLIGLVPLTYAAIAFIVFYGFFLIVFTVHPHELLSICACDGFIIYEVIQIMQTTLMPALACIFVAITVIVRAVVTMPADEPREVLLFGRRKLRLRRSLSAQTKFCASCNQTVEKFCASCKNSEGKFCASCKEFGNAEKKSI